MRAGIEKYLSVDNELREKELKGMTSLKEYMDLVVERKEQSATKLQELFDFLLLRWHFPVGPGGGRFISGIPAMY